LKGKKLLKNILSLITCGVLVMASGIYSAQAEDNAQARAFLVAATQNVDNKICPVTGEKIDEKIKATYEYEGRIYNFCCVMCIDEFKKDPQKYIKKVEEEKASAVKN